MQGNTLMKVRRTIWLICLPIIFAVQVSLALSLIPSPPHIPGIKGYVLSDANSQVVLASDHGHETIEPASLTKLMTLYVIFHALDQHQINMDDQVPISSHAAKTEGSKLFVRSGSKVPVKTLVDGIIIASGNDASVAMAEYVAGSEPGFVELMNRAGEHLALEKTHFQNATGLPAKNHYSTPLDLNRLATAIIQEFPDYYPLFKQRSIIYDKIKQNNRNRLLFNNSSVDGLKTGETKSAGFCLIASAKKNDMRLISVIVGAPTDTERNQASSRLLQYGFHFFKSIKIPAGSQATVPVRLSQKSAVHAGFLTDQYVTIPYSINAFKLPSIQWQKPLQAPLTEGQPIGNITLIYQGLPNQTLNVVAMEPVQAVTGWSKYWTQMIDWIKST
jgi:serine-type D-Ala-D-Ala carboxypeptidase (penicillin-binding protein 5/6)